MKPHVWWGAGVLVVGLAGSALVPVEAGASAIAVATEAEYRAALSTLSADGTGPHTVTLTADLTITGATDPTYSGSQSLTIEGAGHVIDGGGTRRALFVDEQVAVTLDDLVVRNGQASDGLGGGAVASEGPLTVVGSRFVGNHAPWSGGALAAQGFTVSDSRFKANRSARDGGALGPRHLPAGDAVIEASRFTDNRAQGDGGAVSAPEISVDASTFMANRARAGGAIFAEFGSVTIAASTLGGNRARTDGGAVSSGVVRATNSTFSGNAAVSEGGAIDVPGGLGSVDLRYVTLAGNSARDGAHVAVGRDLRTQRTVFSNPLGGGANCANAIGGSSYSYATDDSCNLWGPSNVHDGPAPRLGPLHDNGGPTWTRFPARGSPLLDAVPCAPAVPVDQRGVSRPKDGIIGGPVRCDIGAVEAGPRPPLARPAPTAPPTGWSMAATCSVPPPSSSPRPPRATWAERPVCEPST